MLTAFHSTIGAIIGMTETEIIVSEEPPNPNQLVSVPFCASVIRGVVNQQFSISTSVEDISTRKWPYGCTK